MAMLEVKDLEVYYGMIQAIKGISFEVNQGEVVALIGANGAGKTTTLHTITGTSSVKERNCNILRDRILQRVPAHKIVDHGSRTCTGGTPCVCRSELYYQNLKMGAYTRNRQRRRLKRRLKWSMSVSRVWKNRKDQMSRNTLRRRAADAGNGTGAYVKTED